MQLKSLKLSEMFLELEIDRNLKHVDRNFVLCGNSTHKKNQFYVVLNTSTDNKKLLKILI